MRAASETAREVLALLQGEGQTLATAESLTCGLLAATVADVPGASAVLRGGLAAYATDVKVDVLGVDADLVAREGVVSAACAEAMAHAALDLFGCDWALSTTGVAGPDPQDGQAPGTVFIALAGPHAGVVEQLELSGGRNEIRVATVAAALALLQRQVEDSLPSA